MGREADYTLDTLLEWDGSFFVVGNDYWIKIEAKRIEGDAGKPFGLKYSLTLHNPQGERVLGYDNAHAIPNRSYIKVHDHMHKGSKIVAYNYIDADHLWADFCNDVEQLLARNK